MKLRSNVIDETGHIYGSLTVLEPVRPEGSRKLMWKCQCKCGDYINCFGSDLRTGRRTSCGKRCNYTISETIGKKYGFLKIIGEDSTPPIEFADKSKHWICECELCGTKKSISGKLLRNGQAKSCGCLKSTGEQYITKILNELNLCYKKEYKIEELKDKSLLRFDFAIFDNNSSTPLFFIEFQGYQHFYEDEYFSDSLKDRQRRDEIKLDYCQSNGLNILYFNNYTKKFTGDYNVMKNEIIEYYKTILKNKKENKEYGYVLNYDM